MDNDIFSRRRRGVMELMGDGIAVIPTAPTYQRNGDVMFSEYVLFCRERDPAKEQWDGRRAGLEGACEKYGASDAFPIQDTATWAATPKSITS